jgi:hypothetical protein
MNQIIRIKDTLLRSSNTKAQIDFLTNLLIMDRKIALSGTGWEQSQLLERSKTWLSTKKLDFEPH